MGRGGKREIRGWKGRMWKGTRMPTLFRQVPAQPQAALCGNY